MNGAVTIFAGAIQSYSHRKKGIISIVRNLPSVHCRSTLHKSTVAVTVLCLRNALSICVRWLPSSSIQVGIAAPSLPLAPNARNKNLLLRLRHSDSRINSLILLCNTIYVRSFCPVLSRTVAETNNVQRSLDSRPCIKTV